METEEGSPQGGNLSPLLANIYLNEFDQEFLKRESHASDMQMTCAPCEEQTGIGETSGKQYEIP